MENIFLLERQLEGNSNLCSHSMHVCEKLWSRFNGVDRKDITKIYDGGFLFDRPHILDCLTVQPQQIHLVHLEHTT